MKNESSSDIDRQLEQIHEGKVLSQKDIQSLCQKILEKEPNLVPFQPPVVLCGDIHGQFYDLLNIFETVGKLPEQKHIFLGDYVDRGHHSVQTITLLLLFKVKYPDRIVLLRGNHEARSITRSYGFYDECQKKYGNTNVWKYFTDIFDYFPLTALLGKSIFCVHGGLSPSIDKLDQINQLTRTQEIPDFGPITDLLWSVPSQNPGWGVNPRGQGYTFGPDVSEKFNHTNSLKIIARSHQYCKEGTESPHQDHVVSIFSAPNYQYRFKNQGAIVLVDQDLQLTVFGVDAAEHANE